MNFNSELHSLITTCKELQKIEPFSPMSRSVLMSVSCEGAELFLGKCGHKIDLCLSKGLDIGASQLEKAARGCTKSLKPLFNKTT